MLIYEYDCNRCSTEFEALSRMDDRLLHDCPDCGKPCNMKISAVRSALDPISGDFPGETMKWEKKREGKMAQERKQDKTQIV